MRCLTGPYKCRGNRPKEGEDTGVVDVREVGPKREKIPALVKAGDGPNASIVEEQFARRTRMKLGPQVRPLLPAHGVGMVCKRTDDGSALG
jgi:hypothetical protein